MTEANEGPVTITGHVAVQKLPGRKNPVTLAELRLLLAGADKAGFPDTAEVRVRTGWRTSEHGVQVYKLTVVNSA